jgi:serine protease AprX
MTRTVAIALILFALATLAPAQPPDNAPWLNKIDPALRALAPDAEAEFILYLSEQADLSGAAAIADKTEKGRYVWRELTAVANQTQPAIMQILAEERAVYRPYWVVNMIWARGNGALVRELAGETAVAAILANPSWPLQLPPETAAPRLLLDAVQPNIHLTNAPWAWAQGYAGQGAIIGGQDTGYRWDHEALINQYRGWNGETADHNYNWHDAIHSGGGDCGANSPEPCDDYGAGHGTHTMGIMVAPDLGMAPAAQWIGCRNMDVGYGTPISYSECFQWFIAPTDLQGENPDPARAPHVVNNSWGCPISEGCDAANTALLEQVVNNVRAAGIVVVASAGNDGDECKTIVTPPAVYPGAITVGALAAPDQIASFSSRGPVTYNEQSLLKPDLVAPGSGIYSTFRNGGYGYMSGTSMAAPHVAGLVALIISADPSLSGQVAEIEALLRTTAVPLTSSQLCGGLDELKRQIMFLVTAVSTPAAPCTTSITPTPSTCR